MSDFYTIKMPDGTRVAFKLDDVVSIVEHRNDQKQRETVVYMRSGNSWTLRDENRQHFDGIMEAMRGYPANEEFSGR